MRYAYFIDAETEASRNFDFMLLLGALLFLSSNSPAFLYYPHFEINSHFLEISQALPLLICFFVLVPVGVSHHFGDQGSKIAKFPCKKR